ncbi:hypothetical protein FO519_008999, partial [Halicephalobus sp. NKZ332]
MIFTIGFAFYYFRKKERNPRLTSYELTPLTTHNTEELKSIPTSSLDWENKKQIGRGKFGCVYRCFCNELNEMVAVKELTSNDRMAHERFYQEMGILSGLRHPYVTPILGINCAHPLKIIIPLRKSDLATYLAMLEKPERGNLIRFCFEIADAMIYLHSKNIIHCDLKANNILVKDEFNIEVADFGLAGIMGDTNRIGGTRTHCPLEYLTKSAKHPTKEGDVWSFGVTVWQIFTLCKEEPYGEQRISSEFKMIEVLINGTRLSKPILFHDHSSLWSVILNCFSEDPQMRPTFNHLYSKFARMLPIYPSPPVEQFHQAETAMDQSIDRISKDKATASGVEPMRRCWRYRESVRSGLLDPHKKLVTPKIKLKLAAWNVRTAYQVGQKEIIARELARYGISIAILSELHLTGTGNMRVEIPNSKDTITLYYSGGDLHRAGVGFAVSKQVQKSILSFQPISNRIATLTLAGTIKTHLIAVYSPTNTSEDKEKDDFYTELQLVADSFPKRDLILIAGDFNAHVGSARQGWEEVLGNYGTGNRNDNGLRLLSFAAFNDFVVGNTIFRHPKKHQITWRDPSGKDAATLDYFLIRNQFRTSIKDIRAMRGADCNSDHYLLRALLQLRLRKAKPKTMSNQKRDWSKLKIPVLKRQFEISLANRFKVLSESNDVNEATQHFAEIVTECAKEICPIQRRKTQIWISEETLELVDKRRKAKLTNPEEYKRYNKQVRYHLKKERADYWEDVAKELEVAAHKREHQNLYSTVRRLGGRIRPVNDNIKKEDGTFVRSDEERLSRWKDYFQGLLNHSPPQMPADELTSPESLVSSIPEDEPSIAEVKLALKTLKNGKAAGIDGLTAEMLKAGGD